MYIVYHLYFVNNLEYIYNYTSHPKSCIYRKLISKPSIAITLEQRMIYIWQIIGCCQKNGKNKTFAIKCLHISLLVRVTFANVTCGFCECFNGKVTFTIEGKCESERLTEACPSECEWEKMPLGIWIPPHSDLIKITIKIINDGHLSNE